MNRLPLTRLPLTRLPLTRLPLTRLPLLFVLLLAACPALAGPENFTTGPVIEGYGPVAPLQDGWRLPADTRLRVAMDAAEAAQPGALNRTLESAARFLNMHGAAGVDPDNIDLAVVVHGGAAVDLLSGAAYAARHDGAANATAPLIKALQARGVRVILCGQTAAYRDIGRDDLLSGVELSLSAMTSHARLQGEGYTLNPF